MILVKLILDNSMPLKRKIINVGKSSKGIILPKSWLDFHEENLGEIFEVTIEVNNELRIKPVQRKYGGRER
jgi:antitoxin component of MazEF toxin-antitoxin module